MEIIFNWYLWVFPIFGIFLFIESSKKRLFVSNNTLPNMPLDYNLADKYRASILFSILVFLPMILIAGYRKQYSIGDTYLYVSMFNNYPNNISGLGSFLTGEEKDAGFIIFSTIIKQIFGNDFTIWLLIIAFISGGCLALTYRRYSSEIVFCAFLFFASTDFFAWMTNGMRQFMAAAILFALFPLLEKKKMMGTLIFLAANLILFYFHSSCIIVFPLFLAARGKHFNKKIITVFIFVILAIIFLDQFTSILDQSLRDTNYNSVSSQMQEDDGVNPFRVAFYTIPAFLAIVFKKKVDEHADGIISIAINMSLISSSLYLLGVFTSGIFFGRLPIYFSLFNYILLPWEIKTFFRQSNQAMIFSIVIVLYLIFYIYQMITWGF